MISSHDNVSMALFCDFENVALGVRDANYEKFDIRLVLERLLLKGSIVIKKAYCDWDRYKPFKAPMHEANFELIEIPHVRQSGKNSADIRLVVDALDLCYTKSHVNTFVIISGDSDFSPLVSKLRENAKHVIGVGVKHSTSDLLIANCDEFIFYDDLVRENARSASRHAGRDSAAGTRRGGGDDRRRKEDADARKSQAIDIAVETFDALVAERGDSGKIWASALKDAIKRRKPDFNESYYGFRAFGNLLEEAQARGLFDVGRDEKSGTYVYRSTAGVVEHATSARDGSARDGSARDGGTRDGSAREDATRDARTPESREAEDAGMTAAPAAEEAAAHTPQDKPKRGGRRRARPATSALPAAQDETPPDTSFEASVPTGAALEAPIETPSEALADAASATTRRASGTSRRGASRRGGSRARTTDAAPPASALDAPLPASAPDRPEAAPADIAAAKPRTPRKTAARPRRARKTAPSASET